MITFVVTLPMKNFFILIYILLPITLFSQVQSKIAWLSDSIALGKPIPLSFMIRYPVGYSIIFPDSSKDFFPFELHSKKYFSTQIEGNYAKDSVIYYLSSFQIDSIQKLQLPYAYIFKLDTTYLKSEIAAIPFQRKVFGYSRTTPYLINKNLYEVPIQPDYALWLGIAFVFFLVISLLFMFFRKKIIQVWALLKLYKEWQSIQNQLDSVFQYSDMKKLIYELNFLWKNYLGTQNAIQPVSLTSKEFQVWIENIPELENKQLFIDLCQLEEQIFYASENIDSRLFIEKKEALKQELRKVYLQKRKSVQKLG